MKKIILSTLFIFSTHVFGVENPSFSEIKIGLESIDYSESLNSIANNGRLTQSIKVTNPTIRQLSYSSINDDWGFYVESAATISTDIETETWSVTNFGEIQQNAFKIKANEIGIKAAYNWSNALQLTFGSKIYTSSFTRSNFEFIQPGAGNFDQSLITQMSRNENCPIPRFVLPGQLICDANTLQQQLTPEAIIVTSVSEDQTNLILVTGLRYDSKLNNNNNKISWYLESELSVPVYSQIQNTQFEKTTLNEMFNGWGFMAKVGARYHLTKDIALLIDINSLHKETDVVTKTLSNGRRLRVPNIEYSNISYTLGLYWQY